MRKRYAVKYLAENRVLLHLAEGYGSHADRRPEMREFWIVPGTGYVFDVTHKPGITGRQVCSTLLGVGVALVSSPNTLLADIRRLARQHCDAIDG